jgi:protein required for attachment to host cells
MSLPDTPTPLVTHLLVADSGVARLLRVVGPHKHRTIEQEELFERPSARLHARDLTTDLGGRVFESSGRAGTGATHTRHGTASDYDPHAVEIERFVVHIAQHLESRHRAGALSNLVLIAAPHFLGVMRARLPADVQRLISREISGDYVRAHQEQLLGLLDDAGGR